MNSRVAPEAILGPRAGAPPAAVITPSYSLDFDRCRLLCETLDRHVTGASHHYILVEGRDVARFRQLEGRARTVVDERDLLPSWLHVVDDPLSGFRRRVWLSLRTKPLRGWHVQQLRRIAIAGHIDQPILVYCDSDVVFLKPFDCGFFWRDGKVRLFRRDGRLAASDLPEHRVWSRNAGRALGLTMPEVSPHDYISTLIAWRRDAVTAMCRRMEELGRRDWVSELGRMRRFSECMLYGRYVDEVVDGAGHYHGNEELCRVHWNGAPMSDAEFLDFIAAMAPEQVAIGLQSFIGTDIDRIRRLIGNV